MTIPHLLAALCLCASLLHAADDAAVAPPADKASFHLILLMGQSNMAGSALPILPEDCEPSTRVLALGQDLVWRAARTPLDAARGGGSSPGQSFARHYAGLHPGITVGLIQCGRGGRSLKELAKGGTDRDGAPNYYDSLKRIQAAMKQGTVKAILWHQGESDAGDAKYVDKLSALAADLRSDLGLADVPFIAGELGRYMSWTAGFNQRIPRAAEIIPRSAVASSDGLLELGDRVHFSGFSAEILGARYLMEYLKLAEPALAPRFAPQLAATTAAMAARDAAWDLLLNGDMTIGESRPFAWDVLWIGKGSVAIASDSGEPAAGAPSLRLSSVGGPAQGSLSQIMRGVAGHTIRVTLKARNAGFRGLRANLYGVDGSWKQVYQKDLLDMSRAKEWSTFTSETAIPTNAVNTRIALLVDGEGSGWIDDVVIERLGKAEASELLSNGTMTMGDAVPDGWSSIWASSGKVVVARDTTVSKGAPASLRVSSQGGPAKGQASQELTGAAGKHVTLSGWVRTDGTVGAAVALAAFDGSWKVLAWHTGYQVAPRKGTEWTSFTVGGDIPAGAAHISVIASIDGDGSAWFDEFEAK